MKNNAQRLLLIKAYFAGRGDLPNYMTAFAAAGIDLRANAASIREYWIGRKPVPAHHTWIIEQMEAAVERMKIA